MLASTRPEMVSQSFRAKASALRRTTSTFSSDIALAVSRSGWPSETKAPYAAVPLSRDRLAHREHDVAVIAVAEHGIDLVNGLDQDLGLIGAVDATGHSDNEHAKSVAASTDRIVS